MPRYGHIEIEGLGKLIYKLKRGGILGIAGAPWAEAVEQATVLVEREAEHVAPRRTGKLQASITHRLDPRPVPSWGIVSANATAADGTRYPFILQAGHRTPRRRGIQVARQNRAGNWSMRQIGRRAFQQLTAQSKTWINLHYAGTGRSTRAWLNRALDGQQGRVNGILDRAARKIEQEWSR